MIEPSTIPTIPLTGNEYIEVIAFIVVRVRVRVKELYRR
jgi:hypothetical protein